MSDICTYRRFVHGSAAVRRIAPSKGCAQETGFCRRAPSLKSELSTFQRVIHAVRRHKVADHAQGNTTKAGREAGDRKRKNVRHLAKDLLQPITPTRLNRNARGKSQGSLLGWSLYSEGFRRCVERIAAWRRWQRRTSRSTRERSFTRQHRRMREYPAPDTRNHWEDETATSMGTVGLQAVPTLPPRNARPALGDDIYPNFAEYLISYPSGLLHIDFLCAMIRPCPGHCM